ncbi:neuropilin and tolloid-like protein 2 isoform X2 [Aethina tumida]|uniref:neuropilin and tolloid-like protein 2 isoform X2 n=1 Tax=Aethina tumida TaxID=116153 RepID=UPI00214829E2|nr:neuropilin and tolloid-like protein 2 isoform X2 [Aethina tumida]
MISMRCSVGLTLGLLIMNVVFHPICQAHNHFPLANRYKREVTTMLPEMPQGDMSADPTLPLTDPCYPFVDISNHQFFSPGYPADTYTNNTDCVVVIEAPEGHLIKLDFRDWFAIEDSPECKNDYLEVRDGPHGYNNKLESSSFCGTKFPPMLTSSDRHLWIRFHSDENIEYKGFKAVFEYIPRPPSLKTPEIMPCRMDMTDLDEGHLGKPDIPVDILDYVGKHSMPIDCIWAITVREHWRIQLQFEQFSLEKPNDCESNFVEVFSDRTDMPSREKQFCGSIADTVLSKHNVMFVRFFSEKKESKSTFVANFTAYRDNEKNSVFYKQGCHDDEFDCEDTTCISATLKCNGRYNCRFRWDEDECQSAKSLAFTDDHIIIIMVIFSLILTGMCVTFIYNCIKKLIRDHHTIQEYIRQSREHQLNELDKQDPADKKPLKEGSRSRSQSSPSLDSERFDAANSVNTPCYVPGGEILPILIRNEHSMSPSNGDAYNTNIYTVDSENVPEMCDSACQTRESLFNTQGYNSGNSTPNHSVHTNSPPAPFSTFGYKKEGKFKAEAKIEMTPHKNKYSEDGRRPYSVQTTKSAPDVIVTH